MHTSINYSVPGIIAPIRQPLPMACWAAATAMLVSWKVSAPLSIRAALERVAPGYIRVYEEDIGLSTADKTVFLTTAGLRSEPLQSYTAAGWASLLRLHGPLWVTTAEGPPNTGFSIHARVMVGVEGDGSPTLTAVDLVDPADGHRSTENFAEFARKFEREAAEDAKLPPPPVPTPPEELRVQVVHW